MAEGIVAIVIMLFSLLITLCATLIPIAVMAVLVFVIVKRIRSGQGVVIQTNIPGVAEAIAGAAQPRQGGANRIKKVSCGGCGAAKLTPPKTAYLYCDYCGMLADWDFKIACQSAGSAKPGPEYERLQAQEGPVQARAQAEGSPDAYRESVRRVFDAHMKHCPASYSPRLGDPEYRAALLDFTVNTYTAAAFDPDAQEREVAMNRAVQQLQWLPGFGSTRVRTESFRKLLESFEAHNNRFLELSLPYLDGHPDHPTAELMVSIAASAFVQGWLPYLDKAEQDRVIAELGLAGEYVPVEPVETEERHCGGCGQALDVVSGARRVVCEGCGRMNDMQRPELSCTGCGSPLSVPYGKDRFSCPSCSAEMRLDGVAPM